MMHNLLYGDCIAMVVKPCIAMGDQVMFRDLDMDDTCALQQEQIREMLDDIEIHNLDAIKHIEISDTVDNNDRCIPTSTLCHILTICDKLARHDIIDEILAQHIILPEPHATLIIHHTLSPDALIELYAKTNAYNLLHKGIHYKYEHYYVQRTDTTPIHDIFRNATINGLRVANIAIYDKIIDDRHIEHCTSLTKLSIFEENYKITTCAPFANSLKILIAAFGNGIGDDSLSSCHFIDELIAGDNPKITTCAPFANSLEILNAQGNSGIGDDGLALCHYIKELFACNNHRITTCTPFANSLEILCMQDSSGIGDDGLALCHSIKTLNTDRNHRITTCAPFAKTLTELGAGGDCGITDDGIASCHSIAYLDVSRNLMVTTCAPFATSLKILYAAKSGIRTEGVLLCKSLIVLVADNDGKIDRSKITMAKIPEDKKCVRAYACDATSA